MIRYTKKRTLLPVTILTKKKTLLPVTILKTDTCVNIIFENVQGTLVLFSSFFSIKAFFFNHRDQT